jgi:hypothetical protein
MYDADVESSWDAVIARALKDLPNNKLFARGLGSWYASKMRWPEAIAQYRRLIEQVRDDEATSNETQDWMRTAALLIATDNLEAYNRL